MVCLLPLAFSFIFPPQSQYFTCLCYRSTSHKSYSLNKCVSAYAIQQHFVYFLNIHFLLVKNEYLNRHSLIGTGASFPIPKFLPLCTVLPSSLTMAVIRKFSQVHHAAAEVSPNNVGDQPFRCESISYYSSLKPLERGFLSL